MGGHNRFDHFRSRWQNGLWRPGRVEISLSYSSWRSLGSRATSTAPTSATKYSATKEPVNPKAAMKQKAKVSVLSVALLILLIGGILLYFPCYPSAFSTITPSMTESDVSKILAREGFGKGVDQGITSQWIKKEWFGIWYIDCTFERGKVTSVDACFQRDHHTIRARSRELADGINRNAR